MGPRQWLYNKSEAWLRKTIAAMTPQQLKSLSEDLLGVIDHVSADRWEAAQKRAQSVEGGLRPDRIKKLTRSFSRELGAAGAATGAVAAAPVIGTIGTVAATAAELGWFTTRAGDLILTIAALHGRPDPTVDERRAWVLAVLIYGSSARHEFNKVLNEASHGLTPPKSTRLPLATIQTANQIMGRTLLRKYGTRRGAAALTRLLPIGIGAALGGSSNILAIRALAKNADQFFSTLPYSAIDVEATDITGREIDWSPPVVE